MIAKDVGFNPVIRKKRKKILPSGTS